MKNKQERGRHRVLWGFLYVMTFAAVFVGSAAIKLTYNPLAKETQVNWNESVGSVYSDLSYGDGEANKFDLYVPADKTKDAYGLVVYLHAGGFTAGDKKDDAEMLQWLCSKGYVAAGVNYTLFSEQNPNASVYSQSIEIKNSIPAIVEEAGKLGYPLDRMAISGGSAGGCLALIYGYRDAAESPIPVKMIFEAVCPGSFHHQDWRCFGLDKSSEAASALFSAMAGKIITPEMIKANDYEDEIRDISPDLWVNETSVPLLCAYGAHDKMQPFEASKPLIAALERYGIPHDYIVFPHSGHGLQNDNKCYAAYIDKINAYLERYMGE